MTFQCIYLHVVSKQISKYCSLMKYFNEILVNILNEIWYLFWWNSILFFYKALIHIAVEIGNLDIIQLLLSYNGIDVNLESIFFILLLIEQFQNNYLYYIFNICYLNEVLSQKISCNFFIDYLMTFQSHIFESNFHFNI